MRQFDVEDPRTKPNLSERVHQVLEHRDHLPSVTAEFPISGGNRGRGQPRRLEHGTFRHPRCLCWFGGSSRRIRPVWESNSEPRSGLAIHRNCFGGPLQALEVAINVDGRGVRQRLYRMGVAVAQIRTHLSGRRWLRRGVAGAPLQLPEILPSRPTAPHAWRRNVR